MRLPSHLAQCEGRPTSFQQWDTWPYLLPWDDPPKTWWSSVTYDPAVAPAQPLAYLDITSSRLSRESAEIVLQTTVAEAVPRSPDTARVRPVFAWWFRRPQGAGASGGGVGDRVVVLALTLGVWAARLYEWRNPGLVLIADLPHDISGSAVRVPVTATLLPLNTFVLWSPSTGMFLGDDPEVYYSEVDWIPGIQLAPGGYRIFLPVIRRNS